MSAGHTPAKQPLEALHYKEYDDVKKFFSYSFGCLYIRVAWVKEFSRLPLQNRMEMFFRFRESELTSIITAQI
jgi:hypothetical protein